MRITKPSVEVYFHYPQTPVAMDTEFIGGVHETTESVSPIEFLERVGRTCYKSEGAIAPGTASKFVTKLKELGHWAMLEHCVASVKFVTDRGVSHEQVRHRIASYAQESTRYCNYGKDKFEGRIAVIEPPIKSPDARTVWGAACEYAEQAYLKMLELGEKPEIARSVLPTCTKTEIWVTANLREWAWMFSLRTSSKAHEQIVEVMKLAQAIFAKEIPEIFGDNNSKDGD